MTSMRSIKAQNKEKITILIRNYDDMPEEGKSELLLIGEKYLNKKDRTQDTKKQSENK
jgi:hypothetical protein